MSCCGQHSSENHPGAITWLSSLRPRGEAAEKVGPPLFPPACFGNLKNKFFFSAFYGVSALVQELSDFFRPWPVSPRLWGESLTPQDPGGDGGGPRRLRGGATRLGEPATVTRPRNTRPRARSGRPRSPSRAGRARSAGRGAGGGVTPARGDSKTGSRTALRA